MTPPDPSVSVVIPTYNRAQYLKVAIESALGQDPTPAEVIVVDDGSTDETPALLENFPRIVHIRRERQASSTPAAARNAALRVAKGEYVAFLDDDDLWLPGKLQAQLDAVKAKELVLVSTDAQVVDEDGGVVRERYLDPSLPTGSLEALIVHNWVIASSALVRAEVLQETGGFREDLSLRATEDYELWLRVAARGNVAFIPDTLVAYRVHREGISRSMSRKSLFLRRRALSSAMRDKPLRQKAGRQLSGEMLAETVRAFRALL